MRMNPTPDPTPIDPNRSCLVCPSYLSSSDAANFFSKSTGVPMCARYGKPIARLDEDPQLRDVRAKHFARSCPSFGEPKPLQPDWAKAKLVVTLPDPSIGPPQNQDMVKTCGMCQNFTREDVVRNELGFAAGHCAAKGKLILANRQTFEARDCEFRSFGSLRNSTTGLYVLPEYEPTFQGVNNVVENFRRSQANFIDPVDYPTDKPLSLGDPAKGIPSDHDAGIRAWRKITDPETNNSVWLPIYRRDFFDAETQKLIPTTGDDEHPEDYADHSNFLYKVAMLWTELDETPAFWGQSGTGKTEFFRHMAWLMQLPFHRFSITASTELDAIAGSMRFSKEKGTYWHKSRLVKAWESPCVAVIDEPNAGQDEVWHFFRPLFDNSKQLVIDEDEGIPAKRHDDCYIGLAMNPAHDSRNSGVRPIADADARRLMHISVPMPEPEIEKAIIKKRCGHDGYAISDEYIEKVMKISDDIRELVHNDTLPITWGIAPNLKVARLLKWVDFITAYRMATGDFLEEQAQELLLNVVRTHIAPPPDPNLTGPNPF